MFGQTQARAGCVREFARNHLDDAGRRWRKVWCGTGASSRRRGPGKKGNHQTTTVAVEARADCRLDKSGLP